MTVSSRRQIVQLSGMLLAAWAVGCQAPLSDSSDVDAGDAAVDASEEITFQPPCIDLDGDGFGLHCTAGADCNDGDATRAANCGGRNVGTEGPCDVPSSVAVSCFGAPSLLDSGDTLCSRGTRFCVGGQWSHCSSDDEFTLSGNHLLPLVSTGPNACSPCDPLCGLSTDYPDATGLTTDNSMGVVYDPIGGGITLPSMMGSTLDDTDGDGVPDDYDAYPADPLLDGYHDAVPPQIFRLLPFGGPPVYDPLDIAIQVNTVDIYILFDNTGSMNQERANLVTTIGCGVGDPGCPAAGGIVQQIRGAIPDAWFGLGWFQDFPVSPYGLPAGDPLNPQDTPFVHVQDITASIPSTQAAVGTLTTNPGSGADGPEAIPPSLYSIATGSAITRGAITEWPARATACATAGGIGYPCFRPGSTPIVLLFTDSPMHNGPTLPTVSASNYSAAVPTFNYAQARDALVAIGAKVVTIWSGNDACSEYGCNASTDKGWRQQDYCEGCATVTTSCTCPATVPYLCPNAVPAAPRTGPTACGAVTRACNTCNAGCGCNPSSGNGCVTCSFTECTCYKPPNTCTAATPGAVCTMGMNYSTLCMPQIPAVSHPVGCSPAAYSSCPPGSPLPCNSYNTGLNPLTHVPPITLSPNDLSRYCTMRSTTECAVWAANSGGLQWRQLGVDTGSVDPATLQPVYTQIASNGGTSGSFATSVVSSIQQLAGYLRQDITVVVNDDPSTPAVDETQFVANVVPVPSAQTMARCTGTIASPAQFTQCLPGTDAQFQITFQNNIVMPMLLLPQEFNFTISVIANGTSTLSTTPVRIVVPPNGNIYEPTGYYQRDYDSTTICHGTERPNWGSFTWSPAAQPAGTSIDFVFYTADTLAGLDSATAVTVSTPPTASPIDVSATLTAALEGTQLPYLRVRAVLNADSTRVYAPLLNGFEMTFTCSPGE